MRLSVVRDLVARSRRENESAPILQFSMQLALEAEQNMSFGAPVIGEVSRRVFDHAYANGAELPRTPKGGTAFPFVLGGRYLTPIGGGKREIVDIHVVVFLTRRREYCRPQSLHRNRDYSSAKSTALSP